VDLAVSDASKLMKPAPKQVGALNNQYFDYIPPPGFDPLTAPQADLATYGIVPRPDPVHQPELFHNWLRIFAPPMVFVNPKPRVRHSHSLITPNPVIHQSTMDAGASRVSTSRNWSGAFIVPTEDTMFVLVAGLWTVPSVSLPPPAYLETGKNPYVCSTWVGLDGQRRYLNSSLPQTGTMQFLTVPPSAPPQTEVIAFFQWWDRETGGTFLGLTGLSVRPGDVMIGAVWAKTETTAIAYLRNVTTGHMAIVGANSAVVTLSSGPKVELTISGATAEWILERPMVPGTKDLYPFPTYSTTTFACWAGAALAAGPPQSWHDLQTARFIRMYDTLHNPTRTAFISMPTREGDTAVRLDYGDFKD
jgi:hypothetical protein